MQEAHRERENQIHSRAVFFETAQHVARQESLDSYPVVFEDEEIITRRLFKGDDSYSNIPGVAFYLDYQKKKDEKLDAFLGKLIFEYASHPVSDGGKVNMVQMHFEMHPNHEFRLFHRYVIPTERGDGKGARLFHLTEEWFSRIARELHAPVTLGLQTGQRSVIAWAEKMGFSVAEGDEALRREIDEHPERFFEDEVVVSEESQSQGIVKDRYIFPVGTTERYMDNGAIRLTFKKRILPDAEDSLGSDNAGLVSS